MRHTVSSFETVTVVPRQFPPVSALVVEPALSDASSFASLLTTCGFHVTVAETFAKAKLHLSAQIPNVLVTEVRLAQYNGLHLVLRCKSVRPDMAALVTSHFDDSVLQLDAEAMGATFVVKPIATGEMTAAVLRTLFRPAGFPSTIRPPYERRKHQREAVETLSLEEQIEERRRELPDLLKLVGR